MNEPYFFKAVFKSVSVVLIVVNLYNQNYARAQCGISSFIHMYYLLTILKYEERILSPMINGLILFTFNKHLLATTEQK